MLERIHTRKFYCAGKPAHPPTTFSITKCWRTNFRYCLQWQKKPHQSDVYVCMVFHRTAYHLRDGRRRRRGLIYLEFSSQSSMDFKILRALLPRFAWCVSHYPRKATTFLIKRRNLISTRTKTYKTHKATYVYDINSTYMCVWLRNVWC